MGAARNINYLINMKTVRNYTVGMPNSFILSCNIVRYCFHVLLLSNH